MKALLALAAHGRVELDGHIRAVTACAEDDARNPLLGVEEDPTERLSLQIDVYV